jgi:GxxExxY protein
MELNDVTRTIVLSAIKVHTTIGPGLLESAYEACLTYELAKTGLEVQRQIPIPLIYDGIDMGIGYRLDLLVAKIAIVEVKAVENILPIHRAQVLSYLRPTKIRVGLLLNFNVRRMVDGINRLILDPVTSVSPVVNERSICQPSRPPHR